MVAVNIFDPIVIIVVIYTVLMTLTGLFNYPYPSSFLLLITLAVITSYIYYKVDKNEPILTPVYECETTGPIITTTPFTTMPSTTPFTTMPPTTPFTTMPPTMPSSMPSTMPSTTPFTTMPPTMPSSMPSTMTEPTGPITTLPVI